MKTRAMPSPHRNRRGFLLLDCVMYLALLALILGMTYAAFYRAHENAQNLDRNAAALVRALRAGERWREDVRSATAPPRVREDAGEMLLELPQAAGVVRYRFHEGTVSRQAAVTCRRGSDSIREDFTSGSTSTQLVVAAVWRETTPSRKR